MIYVRLDYGYQFKSYVGEASEYIARYAVSAMACHIARHPISAAMPPIYLDLLGKRDFFSILAYIQKQYC